MAQVAVGCALGYLDLRHADRNWRDGRDGLAAWEAAFGARAAMAATRPAMSGRNKAGDEDRADGRPRRSARHPRGGLHVEQGVSLADEVDGRDGDCLHWLGTDAAGPVATLRVLPMDDTAKIQRVAVLAARPRHRPRGGADAPGDDRASRARLPADGARRAARGDRILTRRLGFEAHRPGLRRCRASRIATWAGTCRNRAPCARLSAGTSRPRLRYGTRDVGRAQPGPCSSRFTSAGSGATHRYGRWLRVTCRRSCGHPPRLSLLRHRRRRRRGDRRRGLAAGQPDEPLRRRAGAGLHRRRRLRRRARHAAHRQWLGKPVFIRRRTPEEIEAARAVDVSRPARSGGRNANIDGGRPPPTRTAHSGFGRSGRHGRMAGDDRRLHAPRLRAAGRLPATSAAGSARATARTTTPRPHPPRAGTAQPAGSRWPNSSTTPRSGWAEEAPRWLAFPTTITNRRPRGEKWIERRLPDPRAALRHADDPDAQEPELDVDLGHRPDLHAGAADRDRHRAGHALHRRMSIWPSPPSSTSCAT